MLKELTQGSQINEDDQYSGPLPTGDLYGLSQKLVFDIKAAIKDDPSLSKEEAKKLGDEIEHTWRNDYYGTNQAGRVAAYNRLKDLLAKYQQKIKHNQSSIKGNPVAKIKSEITQQLLTLNADLYYAQTNGEIDKEHLAHLRQSIKTLHNDLHQLADNDDADIGHVKDVLFREIAEIRRQIGRK